MTDNFRTGQRWISESEPELGLGSILRVTERTVTATFRATDQSREYARANAPLRRVRFRPGDDIQKRDGTSLRVQSVTEKDDLLFYNCTGTILCETELNDSTTFDKPEERLLAGHIDLSEVFELRIAALEQQHRRGKSRIRGFVGARIELIPHQLYIASEVAGRLAPRVLLADEVGLGKTIEACLILHRLILTGRAERVLILVPESLIHQWFVELLRRFNLWFHIFDEERCAAIEAADPNQNPFLDDQLILCSLGIFAPGGSRLEQAVEAGWDILVVDEAHHLGWSRETVSLEYRIVETLSRKTPGLLLLTATPEQLGMSSHFARLRLLDPDRFYDLDEFIKESEHYREVAMRAEKLLAGGTLTPEDARTLDGLLDQHGTGRVRFRNTRATISGFPNRVVQMHRLERPADEGLYDQLSEEFASDTDSIATSPSDDSVPQVEFLDFSVDPRMDWLTDLLRRLHPAKVLLICTSEAKVDAIEEALRLRIKNVKVGVFHEGLNLVQRDRNAAWFADEKGARILICSEIGSEGRNFQFAHHLVLFDLPLDPGLLEQRIGRLDRIGQTSEIYVHVPFVSGSSQEVLALWYQEGLNAFEKNLHGGRELLERFGARLYELAANFHESEEALRPELQRLVEETRIAREEIATRLQEGRDRLLELNSFRPAVAAKLVEKIHQQDQDQTLDRFMLSVFNHFSLTVEEIRPRTYKLGSAGVLADSFPGLPAEGLTVTCDRKRALTREDVQFLTWDHPLVSGALDLLLGSEKGNASCAEWTDKKGSGLYLECIHVLECVAPPHLHVDRFLPPTPLRAVVDANGNALDKISGQLRNADGDVILENSEIRDDLLPRMIEIAGNLVAKRVPTIVDDARRQMNAQLEWEMTRLRDLQKVNKTVRPEEIELLEQQQRALDGHLAGARLRLDAIRLILRGNF
jgi:ATP-dependent helicase HepA